VSLSASGTDTSITYSSITEGFYSTLDILAGVGWGFPLGSNMQMYVGVQAGYLDFSLGNYSGFPLLAITSQGEFAYGAELGFNWILFKFLSLEARLSYVGASLPASTTSLFASDEDVSYLGLSLGVGFAY
jgi:hypothetical protein